MTVHDDRALKVTPEHTRRYEMMKREQIEIHLFDADAAVEIALGGEDTSAADRMSVYSYLE